MRWPTFVVLALLAGGCLALTPEGARVKVYQALKQQTSPRTNPECPKGVPIGDCPWLSGAWYRVVFESYDCTPDALRALAK